MTATLIYTSGLTLYAFPVSQDLADWETHRVELAEGTGDDAGRYTATLTAAGDHLVFVGSDKPAWDAWVASIPSNPVRVAVLQRGA